MMLVEAAEDHGQDKKFVAPLVCLAERARVLATILLYTLATTPNPTNTRWLDIAEFRVKVVYPKSSEWRQFSPTGWANMLVVLRDVDGPAIVEHAIRTGRLVTMRKPK